MPLIGRPSTATPQRVPTSSKVRLISRKTAVSGEHRHRAPRSPAHIHNISGTNRWDIPLVVEQKSTPRLVVAKCNNTLHIGIRGGCSNLCRSQVAQRPVSDKVQAKTVPQTCLRWRAVAAFGAVNCDQEFEPAILLRSIALSLTQRTNAGGCHGSAYVQSRQCAPKVRTSSMAGCVPTITSLG